jgi:hypothetical protein
MYLTVLQLGLPLETTPRLCNQLMKFWWLFCQLLIIAPSGNGFKRKVRQGMEREAST